MLKAPEQGCLVIADISGYTGVLADSELAHSHDALRDLIQTVVSSLRPQFRLAKLEGDAAFGYAVSERARAAWDGGLREMIAGMYRQSMAQLPVLLSREAVLPVA